MFRAMLNRLKIDEKCNCCMSAEEQTQQERSQQIDRELQSYKRRFLATQKIVLLGALKLQLLGEYYYFLNLGEHFRRISP